MDRVMFNPQLNLPALAEAYSRRSALSIQNILLPEVAQGLHDALVAQPWHLEIKDYVQSEKLRVPLTPDLPRDHLLGALDRFPNGLDRERLFFMRLAAERQEFAAPLLAEFAAFIQSEGFLAPMRTLTGKPEATHCWVEATCYERCCFLGGHRDDHHPDNLVAFVFNLTPYWQLDWGGLLMLQYGDIPPVIVPPMWNSLSLFTVPLDHLVSAVSPGAQGRRYSLTGWLRR
jgi:hypothetical protein